MVSGWRLAFCANATKRIPTDETDHPPTSRFNFFFSSTPRTNSPKLTCKTSSSPFSSSPQNSSEFRSSPSLRLSKPPRCRVCLHAVKTAECSPHFHFPCVVRKQTALICPVCTADNPEEDVKLKPLKTKPSDLKIYNDDEPLMSPTAGGRFQFNPIPESDHENDDVEVETTSRFAEGDSFRGFFTTPGSGNIDVKLLPESAVISASRGYETVAVVMEVKAPDVPTRVDGKASSFRAPVDLVAVVDVSNKSNIQTTKRAMRALISSLSSNDRLSIVAFSSCSKRLLPLRRMTVDGRRTARRIIDVIVSTTGQGTSMSAGDAVRKAAKVLEDRRVKNSVNIIIVLSNGSDPSSDKGCTNLNRQIISVQTTRLSHINTPIHTFSISDISGACEKIASFAKSIGRLLSVPVQDLRVQFGSVDVKAVYSCAGRTIWLGSGTGLIELGDFHAEEKREILIELRVPVTNRGAHVAISVRSSYTDPSSQQLVTCRDQALPVPNPNPHPKRSCSSTCQRIERLKCLFITARAVAESRRLAERNDFSGATQLLSSALALVRHSKSGSAGEFVAVVEEEMAELKCRRQQAKLQWEKAIGGRSGEALTPTSAWRTAGRLAKVARMRKSLNRVSDLHGFENARF